MSDDWENRWAIDEAMGPRQADKGSDYEEICKKHYREFWKEAFPSM